MLQAKFKKRGNRSSLGGSGLTASNSFTLGLKASLLGSLRLRLVLDQELEEFSSLVLIQGAIELVERRRYLQTLKENLQFKKSVHVQRSKPRKILA